METREKTNITVAATIKAPVKKVWQIWNAPEHITKWCAASDDWHAPHAENDLQVDGKFKTTMAAKDASVNFDFEGVYTRVEPEKTIEYTLLDGRKVQIQFTDHGKETKIVQIFEAENTNPIALQRDGWQAILDSFKNHTEKL